MKARYGIGSATPAALGDPAVGLFLVHGGLWDEPMDAQRFWHRPGIVDGLERRGFAVRSPDRLRRPDSWTAEADHLAATLAGPVVVVAGSNGCSAAVRLALARPDLVDGLLLAWPATAGDPAIDEPTRAALTEAGARPDVIDAMLAGGILRGVSDDELAGLARPVGVLPSEPDNPTHQRSTADALRHRLAAPVDLPGCPEPPRPGFAARRDDFLDAVTSFAALVAGQAGAGA
jgi:pimeloyl-ACP methyl ester carboxylesterase